MTRDLHPTSAGRLRVAVEDPDATSNLVDYFRPDSPPEEVAWAGSWFERLDGGGDRPEVANHITAMDLVAVGMLSVDIPAPVAIQLLAGHLGEEVAGLLAKVPNGLRLDQASAEDVGPGSPADQLWYRLKAEDKMGRTRTGKLLARKRPLLLPIYDDVIRCYLGAPPGDWWEPLRRELQRDNGHLTKALQALHARAGLPAGVGLLRTLDVVLWRKHQVDHRAGNHPPKVRD